MNHNDRKVQRQVRVRKKVAAVTLRPRLSIFRSNNYVYAQIFDRKGNAVVGVSEKALKITGKTIPTERAKQVGAEIAKLAIAKKIKEVSFDKGRFAYHGRVKALAEGAREGGLQF